MNLTRRRESCRTCQQPIIPPTPSKVILVRVAMATFAVGSGLLEYRRALRREVEAAQLEQLHDTSPDVPLDEHLDQRDPTTGADDRHLTDAIAMPADRNVEATPWPPSHPSLSAVDDDQALAGDGTDSA